MLFLPSNNCKKNLEFTALKKDKIGYMYLELIKDFLCYFPRPQRVICILLKNGKNNILTWQELLENGRNIPDSILKEKEKEQAVNQACMLIYTSGTTGPPKGNDKCSKMNFD